MILRKPLFDRLEVSLGREEEGIWQEVPSSRHLAPIRRKKHRKFASIGSCKSAKQKPRQKGDLLPSCHV